MSALASLAICQDAAGGYLHKIVAASKATYQTRQLVVYLGNPQQVAIVEMRSTPDGRYMRADRDGAVTRVWSDTKHRLVADSAMAIEELAPERPPMSVDVLLAKYDVRPGQPSTLLGEKIVPLDLVRRSDGRLVERMWVQPDSGVIYRRELFGRSGKLVGMSTVLDVRWGSSDASEPYAGARPARVRTSHAAAPASLAYNYKLVGSFEMPADGKPARHWSYSDGLHALSVFRRPGRLRAPEGFTRSGRFWRGPGPGTWMWEGDGCVWTLVAEEPQLDPGQITQALPHGAPSVMSRMGSWWARGFRWLGRPFD